MVWFFLFSAMGFVFRHKYMNIYLPNTFTQFVISHNVINHSQKEIQHFGNSNHLSLNVSTYHFNKRSYRRCIFFLFQINTVDFWDYYEWFDEINKVKFDNLRITICNQRPSLHSYSLINFFSNAYSFIILKHFQNSDDSKFNILVQLNG